MNTKTLLTICLITLFFLFSCKDKTQSIALEPKQTTDLENIDGSITIQGRVTIKGTNKSPLGITTMNNKNQWFFTKDLTKPSATKKKIALGENQRVFVNKEGYYRITINKNDTLALIPAPYLYKQPKLITGLTKSKVVNIVLEALPLEVVRDFEKKSPLGYNAFVNQLKDIDTDTLVTVSGTIYNKDSSSPLKNIPVTTSFVSNTDGVSTFHLTDKYGQFTIKVPKNSHIVINGMAKNYNDFVAKNDTIINLNM